MVRIIREDPDALPPEPAQQEPEPATSGGGPPLWLLAVLGVVAAIGALAGAVFFTAGSETEDQQAAAVTPRPTATATPIAEGLRKQAEAQFLPRMSQPLQELVRAQGWYQELTPEKLALIEMLLKCEQSARSRGEPKAASELFQFATEQGWYGDGFDDYEAAGLTGAIMAYDRSLTKSDAPPVGATISSTIRHRLFEIAELPETGPKAVVVASQDPALGRRSLDYVVQYLPQVEGLVGKFPYPFLYVEVVPELPEEIYGVSYDEFIGLAPTWGTTPEVVAHELTHSTVYGLFPIWFEEGLAYFLGYYLTDSLARGTREAVSDLAVLRATNKVDIINYGFYTEWDYWAETRRGFLFVKSLFDIVGIENLSTTVKQLRTRTYNDNELLVRILELAPEDKQTEIKKLYCDRVVGTTRNYCVAGQ
jgi:hypothetical protein